jgi:glutamyl-tRNA synthetase
MEYDRMGYLPEAMVNYLARLGWSHGNDELFSREQFVEWFDPRNLSRSAAQWDPKKLNWVNAHAMRTLDLADLAGRVAPRIVRRGGDPASADLPAIVSLLRDRCETLEELAEGAMLFCGPYTPADDALRAEVMDDTAKTLLDDFRQRAGALPDWTEAELDGLIKAILKDHGAKMPKLAIPLRVAVTGHKHTPSIGAVLALLGRETVLGRLDRP